MLSTVNDGSESRSLPVAPFSQYAPEKIRRIRADGLGYRDKLRHVDLSLITLNHPDHGVRAFEPRRQVTLREPGVFTCSGDDRSDGLGRGASQCFQGCAPIN
jgi:hypothetical protein